MAKRVRRRPTAKARAAAPSASDHEREVLFEELCDEATSLGRLWGLYSQLYGDREHVQIMRDTAPFFFGLQQKLLREAILLAIQRMLDNAGSHDERTASLESLIQMITARQDAPLGRRLRKQLKGLRDLCVDVREWRRRQLAHLDLRTVLLTHTVPLRPVQLRVVTKAVEGIQTILTEVGNHFGYPISIEVGDLDGDTLMFLLQSGRAANPPLRFE
jgi:hypothetical protein